MKTNYFQSWNVRISEVNFIFRIKIKFTLQKKALKKYVLMRLILLQNDWLLRIQKTMENRHQWEDILFLLHSTQQPVAAEAVLKNGIIFLPEKFWHRRSKSILWTSWWDGSCTKSKFNSFSLKVKRQFRYGSCRNFFLNKSENDSIYRFHKTITYISDIIHIIFRIFRNDKTLCYSQKHHFLAILA